MISRVLDISYNGRLTSALHGQMTNPSDGCAVSYDVAKPQKDANYWSATENNSNNAWNVNFGNGNLNNNNKNNSYVVRPVTALEDKSFDLFVKSVWDAFFDCLRGKSSSMEALGYLVLAEWDIPRLARELWEGTYQPSISTCFLVTYPKLREVFAANFRDRIVHHWVCLRLNPLFEARFENQGNVPFNCRKHFGTNKAVEHVANEMCRISHNYHRKAWVFRGDLVGFFMSIDKDILWYHLDRFITRWQKRYIRSGWQTIPQPVFDRLGTNVMPEMYWTILYRTTKTIVMHHPERNCVINTNPAMWNGLAPNKSLFTSVTGEPIGNLTTQLFANFLMTFFVSYIQYKFRGREYGMAQFVDDFVLVSPDHNFLLRTISDIEVFLDKTLHLKLHKDKRYFQPVSHGLMFVGTYIKPSRLYLSNRTLARFEERCNGFRALMESRALTSIDCRRIEEVINSYLGFCRNRSTYHKRVKLINSMGAEFWRYFFVRGHYETIRIRPSYRPVNINL